MALVTGAETKELERLALLWRAEVHRFDSATSGEALLRAVTSGDRVIIYEPRGDLDAALTALTRPTVALRATVASILRAGTGPGWIASTRGMTDTHLVAFLDGWNPETIHVDDIGLPESAAWIGGLVATGGTLHRRVTICIDHCRWILDAAHGHGLVVRPNASGKSGR